MQTKSTIPLHSSTTCYQTILFEDRYVHISTFHIPHNCHYFHVHPTSESLPPSSSTVQPGSPGSCCSWRTPSSAPGRTCRCCTCPGSAPRSGCRAAGAGPCWSRPRPTASPPAAGCPSPVWCCRTRPGRRGWRARASETGRRTSGRPPDAPRAPPTGPARRRQPSRTAVAATAAASGTTTTAAAVAAVETARTAACLLSGLQRCFRWTFQLQSDSKERMSLAELWSWYGGRHVQWIQLDHSVQISVERTTFQKLFNATAE